MSTPAPLVIKTPAGYVRVRYTGEALAALAAATVTVTAPAPALAHLGERTLPGGYVRRKFL